MKKYIIAILLTAFMALSVSACSDNDNPPQEDGSPDTSQTEEAAKTDKTDESTDNVAEEISVITQDKNEFGVVPFDTELHYEFTEEDGELHSILEELDNAWSVFVNIVNVGTDYATYENSINVYFTQVDSPTSMLYLPLSDQLPFDDTESMKAELSKYFTEYTAGTFISYLHMAKGEVVSKQDDVYTLDMVSYESMPVINGEVVYDYPLILELDGKLYKMGDGYEASLLGIDYDTTRVLSRTEDQIDFAFIMPYGYEEKILTAQGRLRYEDGWKYDWNLMEPEELGVLDFYEVWGGGSSVKGILIGEYDRSSLADFDYSGVLEETRSSCEGAGDFLDGEYDGFKELYQKAYALASVIASGTDGFPNTFGYGTSDGVKWDDAVQIQIPDKDHPEGCYTYYLTGYSWDSFYNEMLSIFTKHEADRLIHGRRLFLNYDGALWYSPDAADNDPTHVHDEYHVEANEYVFNITRTSYHVPPGADPEFDPEKIDKYETQETFFFFTNTRNGWRSDRFDAVR